MEKGHALKKLLLPLSIFLLIIGCGTGGGKSLLNPASPGNTGNLSEVDRKSVGFLGPGYLKPFPYSRLIIEVDYAEGLRPSASALTHLKDILETYTDKPEGIFFMGETVFRPPREVYSDQDILELAARTRNFRTSGNTATLQILYLNGRYEKASALGIALNSSTIAVFADQIEKSATLPLFPSQIESAILVHEVGHLFGLVNITYHSPIDHEDPKHPFHDVDKNCVMYWAVEDINLSQILRFGPPTDFTEPCKADLRLLKGNP